MDSEMMSPGPELDALVARFLGYEVKPLSEWPNPSELGPWWPFQDRATFMRSVWTVEDPEDACCLVEGRPPEGVDGRWTPWLIPKYSTSIEEAWTVFKRIREIDGTAMVGLGEVELLHDAMGSVHIAHGMDAAHAICLAAKWLSEHPGAVETHRRRR